LSVNDPKHWRLKANEARRIAESFTNELAREQLIECAERYDRLAALTEESPARLPSPVPKVS
jgi:hypothetical protein